MRPKILVYSDDPNGATGYSRQARNLLVRLAQHAEIAVIGVNRADESPERPFSVDDRLPFKVYRANIEGKANDPEGRQLIMQIVPRINPDVLLLMGDVWAFSSWINDWLEQLQISTDITTVGYLSTEYPLTDSDRRFIGLLDYPITHSRWGLGFENGAGFEAVKSVTSRARYIPDTVDPDIFFPLSETMREQHRRQVGWAEKFVIMNVNRNTDRKDLQATIRAFLRTKKEIPNAHLYLHTAPQDTWHGGQSVDLRLTCQAMGLLVPEDVSFPANFTPHFGYPTDILNCIYNAADLIVSTSVSEGFGVTPVEALFCERPVLIPGHTGFSNICETVGLTPVRSYSTIRERVAPTPVRAVDEDDLVNRMVQAYEQRNAPTAKLALNRQAMAALEAFSSNKVFERDWMPIVRELSEPKPKIQAVLWAQESSAGDVLMSTAALAGLRERHPGLPIHYMTKRAYHDLVTDHPLVDQVLDWRPVLLHRYEAFYAPHLLHIQRGHWGAGSTALGHLYPLLCRVPYAKPTISEQPIPDGLLPPEVLEGPYLVVHTTSHLYRNYYRFHEALSGAQVPVIQIGAESDIPLGVSYQAGRDVKTDIRQNKFTFYDLRGMLSYRQTAWLMKRAAGFLGIDSFPMHLAGALDIPAVVTFGSARASITGGITDAPHVYIEPDFATACPILGPCSGNYSCNNPCGPRHDPQMIRKALKQIMGEWLFPKPIDPEQVVLSILGKKQSTTELTPV